MEKLELKIEAVNALNRAAEIIWQYEYEHCNTTVCPFKKDASLMKRFEHPVREFEPGEIPVSKGFVRAWYRFEYSRYKNVLFLNVNVCLWGGKYKDGSSFTIYEELSIEFADVNPYKLYEPRKLPTFNVKDVQKLGKIAEQLNEGFTEARQAIPYQFREYFRVK